MSKYPDIFDNNHEIYRWGPVLGFYFYNSDFSEEIFPNLPAPFEDVCWTHSLFMFNRGRMLWVNDLVNMRKWGGEIFKKYILPTESRNRIKNDWLSKKVKALLDYENLISRIDLKFVSNLELLGHWKNFNRLIKDFLVPTLIQEGGNYGSDYLLEQELKKYIKDGVELSNAMEVLTAPEELSFFQQEEIDLAETGNIEKHRDKYYWLKNSYGGVHILSTKFFEDRKKDLAKDLRQLLSNKLAEVKNRKRQIIKRYLLSNEVIEIATALCDGIVWQDERKKNILIILHFKNLFINEVSRRKNIKSNDLMTLSCQEVTDLLLGSSVQDMILRRQNAFGFILTSHGSREINGEEAKYYWDKYIGDKITETPKSISGIVASRGEVNVIKGIVRILLDPHNLAAIKVGEILVAPMTSPEYIFAMKKSLAIITDTGGLTSHAAIISRELNKLCIVGAKIATKVLKDGDLVEVDAEKGVVRIIN